MKAPDLDSTVAFLTELDRLKLVYRRSYARDLSRRENSAEHSWHLAMAVLTFAEEMELPIDVPRTVAMALAHDVCEIDAGDVSVYERDAKEREAVELACMNRIAGFAPAFAQRLRDLWLEYEAQETPESRWLRVFDRLMPFIVNVATEGRAWRDDGIRKSQVLGVHDFMRSTAPEIHAWVVAEVDACVRKGWLIDA